MTIRRTLSNGWAFTLAVFDVVAVCVVASVALVFVWSVFWPAVAVALAYFVVLLVLIGRTNRRWSQRRWQAVKELVWDLAILHGYLLPLALISLAF